MASVGLAALGCNLSSAPTVETDGRYILVKFNSSALPVKIVELPINPHEPVPSGCWYMLSEGEFGLAASDHTFGYFITYRNSCGWYVLYSDGTLGRYELTGAEVQFHPQLGDRFGGHLVADTLIVVQAADTFYFKRDLPLSAGTASIRRELSGHMSGKVAPSRLPFSPRTDQSAR